MIDLLISPIIFISKHADMQIIKKNFQIVMKYISEIFIKEFFKISEKMCLSKNIRDNYACKALRQ